MNNKKAKCAICGFEAHILAKHIVDEHEMDLSDYFKQHGAFLSGAAKTKLKSMEAEADNTKIDLSIKSTFNVKLGAKKLQTWGWKHPHATTPKLDSDYVFRNELMALLIPAHEDKGERVLFIGPTGSGKSTVIEQTAARLNVPFYRVNLDNEITKADFVGQYTLKGDETVYQYGVLPLAMKQGAWLLVDEWDMGNAGVTACLQAVLEGKPLQIADTGEIVQPADGFRIFATGNTKGQGDETGMYSGTQVQNAAQLDRFTMVEEVGYPSPAIERNIIKKQCGLNDKAIKSAYGVSELSEKDNCEAILRHITAVAGLIRKAFIKEEITTTMSTRTLVNIGKKLIMFGDPKKAYEVCYLNKLTTEDKEFCSEIIQREWGI
jgi:cobaltochelatase CobS